jgi:two-component system, NtrC family, response regulator GlrR
MAAAGSDHATTLVLTGTEGGELVTRRWTIRVTDGPDRGKSITKSAGTIMAGSDPSADLCLSDETVSRFHAELRLLAEGVMVIDLGSTNGTRVGKTKVDSVLLQPGGAVRLGHTTIEARAEDETLPIASGAAAFGEFVTENAALEKALAQLKRAAEAEATVLIEGETGCGKEILAQAIHDGSRRRVGPFVVLDCGSAAETLLESELFGHTKGSFTGAIADRAGAIEAASGGTLFLDELGELPLQLQPKLLRVLESRKIRRLGENKDRTIDVRFVAATNRDLEAEVAAGRFRADLFYRVAVVRARISPLRERREDIPLLARRFVERFAEGKKNLASDAIAALTGYDFPGNVRELRNVIERAVALTTATRIGAEDLLLSPKAQARPSERFEAFHESKDKIIAEFERRYVLALLGRHQGNVTAAAHEAGLSRPALYALMKRTGVVPE